MPRNRYTQQLDSLQHDLLEMGSIVDHSVERAMQALGDRDLELASRVVTGDAVIDAHGFHLQNECVVLLAQQAPMASDLRFIISVGVIALELERMADHAAGIGKIVQLMRDEPLVKPLIDLPQMAERAREMLRTSVEGFVARDVDTAERLGPADDEVDRLHDQIYRDLVEIMVEDPATIEPSTHLLWVAHNLERVADRATNIAERTIFTVTGLLPQLNDSTGRISRVKSRR